MTLLDGLCRLGMLALRGYEENLNQSRGYLLARSSSASERQPAILFTGFINEFLSFREAA
jgi:hypothetical protein